MKAKLLIFLIIGPLLGLSMAGGLVYYKLIHWKYDGPDTTIEIAPGEPFSRINYKLSKREIISSAKLFHRYAQFKSVMDKMKSGVYQIPSGVNMLDVFGILLRGKSVSISVTIPEGKNLYEVAAILAAQELGQKKRFIAIAKDPEFAESLGVPAKTLEGYLYPDTYQFPVNADEKDVIVQMTKTFFDKTKDLPFQESTLSPHEVVILASVVEKETGAKFERPRIAGVFHNRLNKRMRLQSDPTTIYGIWESYNGNLRKKHLLEKTPYNTYKISGLPAGPISNPGLESIKAVLEPESHQYLYFVSKNDGTHVFSETYRKHRQAVEDYQKNRAARRGKSWRDLKQN